MGKLVLYLAVSVDGYLADEQGGVGWLGGDGSEPENFGSYPAFYETVEVILMGWSTYHQIVTALSPVLWAFRTSARLYAPVRRSSIFPRYPWLM